MLRLVSVISILTLLAATLVFGYFQISRSHGEISKGETQGQSVMSAAGMADEDRPDLSKIRCRGLADAQSGRDALQSNDVSEATLRLTQAIESLETLRQYNASDLETDWTCAAAKADLGRCFLVGNDLKSAEAELRRAVMGKLKAIEKSPDEQSYWESIARDYQEFGSLFLRRGDLRNAKQAYFEAIRWNRQVLGNDRDSTSARLQLAGACAACARTLDRDDGAAWSQETAAVYKRAFHLLAILVSEETGGSVAFRDFYLLVRDYSDYVIENEAEPLIRLIENEIRTRIAELDDQPPVTSDSSTTAHHAALLHALVSRMSRMCGPAKEDQKDVRDVVDRLRELVKVPIESCDEDTWEAAETRNELAWIEVTEGLSRNAGESSTTTVTSDRDDAPPADDARSVPATLDLALDATRWIPEEPRYWTTLGVVFYRNGEFASAVRSLEHAMQLRHAEDGLCQLFLAMALQRLGKPMESRDHFERADEWIERFHPMNRQLIRFREEAAEVLGEQPTPGKERLLD